MCMKLPEHLLVRKIQVMSGKYADEVDQDTCNMYAQSRAPKQAVKPVRRVQILPL